MKQYSIKDIVTEKYSPLDGAENHRTALRKFNDFLRKQPEEIREDFQLYYVGNFSLTDGILTGIKTSEKINN